MKLVLMCLGLALSVGCQAAAVPQQHEDVGFAAPVDARQARPHRPLFEVRYVLVRATSPSRPDPMPAIDLGDGKAAIHPVALDGPGVVTVGSKFSNPNMELCHSWGCEAQPRR